MPKGLKEWDGPDGVRAAFTGWFGDMRDYRLVDSGADTVGSRLYLRWRLRVRAERLGPGWFTVEQHLYADADAAGRLTDLRLLCSGYCPETVAAPACSLAASR